MNRILSGIQPSGSIHIGNYFGMIDKMVKSMNDGELFAFIASYHAMTSVKNKELLEKNIFNTAIDFLSLGLEPNKCTFWIQHHVKEVLELYWILSNHTPLSLCQRGHSYKDKTSKGIMANHGLFSYPILMAADILLYDAIKIPIGKDQIQHIEMTRDIAKSFNEYYKTDIFKLPVGVLDESVHTIIGTNGAKMSKSYNNTIDVFSSKKLLKKQVMKITTDSKGLNDIKDYTTCNIYSLCKLFMNEDELEQLQIRYQTAGNGYGHFKLDLMDKIYEYFTPYRQKRAEYLSNPKIVQEILESGRKKASLIASLKIESIRSIVGLD
jgi:tryptophanyl-tRNA synthetase